MDQEMRQTRLSQLATVFSPAAPIISNNLFFGRIEHLREIADAIQERGQHVVLFGERGVGKTSLANIIESRFAGVLAIKVTCNRSEDFNDVWHKILKKVSIIQRSVKIGFEAIPVENKVQLDLFLKKEIPVTPENISELCEYIKNPVVFIFDEFDSLRDEDTRIRFTDAIKAMSDNAPHITLVIVGIADSVGELIGEHPSIERCLKQVKLPRMSSDELGAIIENGVKQLKMRIEDEVKNKIIRFSQGFPHYTHLLAKYSAKAAIEMGSEVIGEDHFSAAVSDAIDNVQESVRNEYQKAILTAKDESMFDDVVSACALVEVDEYDTFRAMDLAKHMQTLRGKEVKPNAYTYHIGKLCQEERGCVIQKIGRGKRFRYRFRNPLLKAFISLRLYQSGNLK